MNGNGLTYYFWIVARNRVGYNLPSNSTSLVIGAGKSLIISPVNFTKLDHEDWTEYVISTSTTNTYASSRIIYERKGTYDGLPVTIDSQLVLNGTYQVATEALLPSNTGIPNGYRVTVTSLNNTYYYALGSTATVNGLTVLAAGVNARWLLVPSASLIEPVANYNKELFQVVAADLKPIELPSSTAVTESVSYYIINTNIDSVLEGELDLNIFQSDNSLRVGAKVEVVGYLDMSTYVLDTTGMPYIGSLVQYPTEKVSITKPLPPNSALVFKVLVDIDSNQAVLPGTFLSLYPRLNSYITVDKVEDWAQSVDSISMLQALPLGSIKDGQSVHIKSVNKIYSYNASSVLLADGDSVVQPGFNPATGRWLSNSSTILNASITQAKLSPGVLALLEDKVENITTVLSSSAAFTLDFEAVSQDYYILKTPQNDNATTTINFKHDSLANGRTVSKLLELVQDTGEVAFHSSILFPGGNLPLLSGAAKTDLILLTLRKDSAGGIKKRATVLQRNIG
jgi:hypothetical protein